MEGRLKEWQPEGGEDGRGGRMRGGGWEDEKRWKGEGEKM